MNDIDQHRILVEAPVARLAAGEYLLTAEAQPDKKSPPAATAGCTLLNRQESGVYGVPK